MAIAGYEFPALDARIDLAAERMPAYAQLPDHVREGHRMHLEMMREQREQKIRDLGQEALFSLEQDDSSGSTGG